MTRATPATTTDRQASAPPARRVILLGASNLTKSIGRVVATAANLWEGPLEVLAAWGHGRSYGRTTRVLGLQMPGIDGCGLWRDLAAGPAMPTAALVTDIGNDLIYEEPVDRVVGWLERCFDRLAAAQASTIVTLWPIENLGTISNARYVLMRTILFPYSRIGLAEVGRRAIELDAKVERMARDRGMQVVRHRPDWYGFDPIHIRLSVRRQAWREMLSAWAAEGDANKLSPSARHRTLYLRTRVPEWRRVLGIEQRGPKPSARLAGGGTVTIY